jgi:hypothetical protein
MLLVTPCVRFSVTQNVRLADEIFVLGTMGGHASGDRVNPSSLEEKSNSRDDDRRIFLDAIKHQLRLDLLHAGHVAQALDYLHGVLVTEAFGHDEDGIVAGRDVGELDLGHSLDLLLDAIER